MKYHHNEGNTVDYLYHIMHYGCLKFDIKEWKSGTTNVQNRNWNQKEYLNAEFGHFPLIVTTPVIWIYRLFANVWHKTVSKRELNKCSKPPSGPDFPADVPAPCQTRCSSAPAPKRLQCLSIWGPKSGTDTLFLAFIGLRPEPRAQSPEPKSSTWTSQCDSSCTQHCLSNFR